VTPKEEKGAEFLFFMNLSLRACHPRIGTMPGFRSILPRNAIVELQMAGEI
jgi:hypothetical protein